MRKKNGFISMSIIYSFFTVFILVSTSLLLIYSNNLAIVKTVNKEIKEELTHKGNTSLMVFKNLIDDGSFENFDENWKFKTDSTTKAPNLDEQRYYGNVALGMVKNDDADKSKTLVQSKKLISMIKGHYYYISRVYLSYQTVNGAHLQLFLLPSTNADYTTTNAFDIMDKAYGYNLASSCTATSTDNNCRYGNRSIRKERYRYQSGFCIAVANRCGVTLNPTTGAITVNSSDSNTTANTFESGIFQFDGNTGDYKLLIGADFSSYSETAGIPPRYYTDGYMLFDLTIAFQLDEAKAKKLFSSNANPNPATPDPGYRYGALKIDELLEGRFIENQKTFPINSLDLS